VWAEVNRRSFLLGSAASLIQAAGGFGRVGLSAQQPTRPSGDPFAFAATVQQTCPGVRLSRLVPDYGVDWTLLLPGGRALNGATAGLQVHKAHVRDGRVLVHVSDPGRWREFTRGRGRGLLIGADTSKESTRLFAVDTREARHVGDERYPVSIPAAYELDDLSYGILWATANLDDGLQADDQGIAACRTELAAYERLPASAVSREAAPT
jgi:hypothetical protein